MSAVLKCYGTLWPWVAIEVRVKKAGEFSMRYDHLLLDQCCYRNSVHCPHPQNALSLQLPILVECVKEAVDILLGQIVRGGQTQLVRIRAADANFLFLPEPLLQVHPRKRRNVHRCDPASHRRIRRGPRNSSTLYHRSQNVVAKLAMTLFNPVHPDVICQLDRCAQSPERGHVRTPDPLEAFCPNFYVVPAFGGDGVPHLIDHFVSDVEESRALRRLQPLVRTGRIEIAAQIVQIEAHHAGGVCAICGGENTFGPSQRTQLLNWQHDSGKGADMTEEQHPGSRGDGVAEKIQDLRGIFYRFRKRNFLYDDPVAFGA